MSSISECLRLVTKSELSVLHTAMPGNIITYDYNLQQASIQPSIRRVYPNGVTQDMPVLNSVPVIFPRAGKTGMTFPVNPGDACLIIFNERSMDQWFNEGGQVTPIDPRQFSLSDAVAIMGLYSYNDPLPLQNNTDFVISHEGSTITIKGDGEIDIKTSSKVAIGTTTTELLRVLSDTLALLQSLTAVQVPSVPFTGPLGIAADALLLQTELDLIRGTIT